MSQNLERNNLTISKVERIGLVGIKPTKLAPWMLDFIRRIQEETDIPKVLEFAMKSNTSFSLGPNELSPVCPESAFFSFNPAGGRLIIETIRSQTIYDRALLHEFLREYVNYSERTDSGWLIRSGHLTDHQTIKLGLIDAYLFGYPLPSREDQLFLLSLIKNDILPLTSDGYPLINFSGVMI